MDLLAAHMLWAPNHSGFQDGSHSAVAAWSTAAMPIALNLISIVQVGDVGGTSSINLHALPWEL
eukprot:2133898-Amphidinium_carterae.1